MKKNNIIILLCFLLVFSMCFCCCAQSTAYNKPVTTVSVPLKSATIDGVESDGEWDYATALTLNISDTTRWEATYNPPFLGNIMPPEDHTDEDFCNQIKMMAFNDKLYYFESRVDSTPFYLSDSLFHPYCQDGSLVWFVLPDGTLHSLSVFADNDGSGPFILFNENDDQENGILLEGLNITAKLNENGHVIEAEIPLEYIGLSMDLLEKGVKTTYATVNIFDKTFDGNKETLAESWGKVGYEAWYTGVNSWEHSPVIRLSSSEVYGDVDEDYVVNSVDALIALQSGIKKYTIPPGRIKFTDVDCNKEINAIDALLILQFSIKKITYLPVN